MKTSTAGQVSTKLVFDCEKKDNSHNSLKNVELEGLVWRENHPVKKKEKKKEEEEEKYISI